MIHRARPNCEEETKYAWIYIAATGAVYACGLYRINDHVLYVPNRAVRSYGDVG